MSMGSHSNGGSVLLLTRHPGQSIKIGDDIEITIFKVSGSQVRIGINAPKDINIVRTELLINTGNARTKEHDKRYN